MKNLKNEWEEYQKSTKKLEMDLDQVKILSWVDSKDSTAYFRVIDPLYMKDLNYPPVKVSKLTPAQLEMIRESGLAFQYAGRVLLVDKLLFKSFVDLFGLTKATAKPSLWRDLHLADLFNEQGDSVVASYGWCDDRRTVMAFHSRNLQVMGITVYSLATGIMNRMNAELLGCSRTKTKFQVELDLHEEKGAWKKTIIIRDDCIGRESLTVLLAYRKGDSLVYINELKKSHRIRVTFEEVFEEIKAMADESSFTTEKVTYGKVLAAVKPVVGKRRMAEFNMLVSKHLQEIGCCIVKDGSEEPADKAVASPDQLLEIAASANASQYGTMEDEFRFHLGMLCKC